MVNITRYSRPVVFNPIRVTPTMHVSTCPYDEQATRHTKSTQRGITCKFILSAMMISTIYIYIYMKSSDAKASKCHLKFSSRMIIFIKLVYLSSLISLKWGWRLPINCHLSEIAELKYTSLIKMIILEENFKW